MEPVTQGGCGRSHPRGLQEAAGQPSVSYGLRWIPAMSRGLDSMALEVPSCSTVLCFYDCCRAGFLRTAFGAGKLRLG